MTPFAAALPDDEHNRRLMSNVHPSDWVNPTPAGRYNLVVLGAGTAGLVTAAGAAGLGAKVALVERELLGGDCLNIGCVPSKALISAAKAVATVRGSAEFGVRIPNEIQVDFAAVMQRMRKLRAGISPHDSAARFRDLGVDVYLGEASFSAPNTILVNGQSLEFSKAVIATGARAWRPDIPGLEEAGFLTNETVFSLTELPRRLAILGAGPIGCELAQSFARFGAEVHLVEVFGQILGREDREAADIVQQALLDDGIELHLNCQTTQVERTTAGKMLTLRCGEDQVRELEVDEILVGAGRIPNVDGLNLEAVGVEYDARSGVLVDDRLQTTNPRIYAAGDICSRYKFTHAADAMARIVIQNALFPRIVGRAKASSLLIPWCTYTQPEIAHVGLYEHEARERNVPHQVFTQPLAQVDRAILEGETNGFVKVVADPKGNILGATIVAGHAGDLISEITVAIRGGLKLGSLASTIHPYPTQAEAIKRIGDQFNRGRLKPWVKRVFDWWMARTR